MKRAVSLLLTLTLGLGVLAQGANPSVADPYNLNLPSTSQRLQRLQQQLAAQQQLSVEQKKELESLRKNVAALSAQQKAVLRQIDGLAARLATLQTQKGQLEGQIRAAQDELAQTQAQAKVTANQVARLKTNVRALLLTLYRERSGQYLRLVNQASSLSDLVIRTRYANMGGQRNVDVIEELRQQEADLKVQQAAQSAQTARLQDLRAEQLSQLAELRDTRAQQQALVQRLEQNKAGQQALALQTRAQQALTVQSINTLLGGIVQERAQIEAERQRRIEAERQRRAEELRLIRAAQERARQEARRLAAQREAQRQAAQRQAAQRAAQQAARANAQRQQTVEQEQRNLDSRANQLEAQQQQSSIQLSPLPAASGPLGFPLPGGSVVAPFSASVPWTVIGGPAGAQAVAAQGGNVLAVTNYATLGWVVLIEHSSTLATAYIGLDSPSVEVGARVTQGQALGLIGGSPVFGAGRMAFQVNRIRADNSRQPIPPTF